MWLSECQAPRHAWHVAAWDTLDNSSVAQQPATRLSYFNQPSHLINLGLGDGHPLLSRPDHDLLVQAASRQVNTVWRECQGVDLVGVHVSQVGLRLPVELNKRVAGLGKRSVLGQRECGILHAARQGSPHDQGTPPGAAPAEPLDEYGIVVAPRDGEHNARVWRPCDRVAACRLGVNLYVHCDFYLRWSEVHQQD